MPASPENPLGARVLLFVCRHRVPVFGKLVRLLFNSDIYCRVRSAILMPHPYGIVIHSKARIGRGVVIGANAVVTRDVPSYRTVVGANRILRKVGRDGDREDADTEADAAASARKVLSSLQNS